MGDITSDKLLVTGDGLTSLLLQQNDQCQRCQKVVRCVAWGMVNGIHIAREKQWPVGNDMGIRNVNGLLLDTGQHS